jgi:hypothetical protein
LSVRLLTLDGELRPDLSERREGGREGGRKEGRVGGREGVEESAVFRR